MSSPDPTALGICIAFPILTIASTAARICARRKKRTGLALEDWIIIVASFLAVGNAVNVLYGAIEAGLGQHTPTDPNGLALLGPKITSLAIMAYVSETTVTTTIGLARWSILVFYSKLFPVRAFRIPVRIMYALNGVWTLGFALSYFMQCIPIDHLWTQPQGARTGCIDDSINLVFAVSGVILDALVLCMPWPMIWRLQMPLARKLAVLGILMLGALIVAVSIGKAIAFFNIGNIIMSNHDVLFDEAPLFYWTVPECCLSVVCANLPTLRPLFHGVSPESVMSSVRSIFRVRSTSSIGSKESQAFEKSSGFSAPDGTASSQSASREEKNHLHPADIQVKTLMSVESRPMPSRDT